MRFRSITLAAIMAATVSAMQINVKLLTGKIYTLDVDRNDLVETVKLMMQDKTGSPANTQRLIYAGLTLQDGRTLEDYNILDKSTLNLLIVRPVKF